MHSQDSDVERVYLGLGGNVGDVLGNMSGALMRLDQHEMVSVVEVSEVYKTPPWGITEQDWFLNCCASIDTSLSPQKLLNTCLEIEKDLKRVRGKRWGPRSVDIDILVFGQLAVELPDLTIPHPRMHQRAFVMLPLADIAKELKVNSKTPVEWIKELDCDDIQKVELPEKWWRS